MPADGIVNGPAKSEGYGRQSSLGAAGFDSAAKCDGRGRRQRQPSARLAQAQLAQPAAQRARVQAENPRRAVVAFDLPAGGSQDAANVLALDFLERRIAGGS